MIHWISGPAYSGKTTYLYHLAQTLCAQGRRVFFFVPEQETAAVEADLVSLCGNTANGVLEVLNFQRLPNRVFRELGGLAAPVFGRTERVLVLAQVLRSLAEHLKFYQTAFDHAEVLGTLLNCLETLSRSEISPQALEAIAKDQTIENEKLLCDKLNEISLILSAYEAACADLFGSRVFDEQRRLIELLDLRDDVNFFENATVLIDGFYDFTAPEYELVYRMGRLSKDLYLSFLSQEGQEELFSRSEHARKTLERLCEGIPCETVDPAKSLPVRKGEAPEDLAFLCDHVSRAPQSPYPEKPERIRVNCAKTPLDEVRLVLEEIFSLCADGALDFSDCAVLYRDGTLYGALLREEAKRYGIPLYTGEKKALIASPLSLFFRCASRIAAGDTQAQTLISLLQTGLMPFTPSEIGMFQRYIRTWDLEGDALYKDAPFTASTRAYQALLNDQMKAAAQAELDTVNTVRERLIKLVARLKEGFAAPDFAGKVDALKRFAETLKVPEQLSQKIVALRFRGRFSEAAVEEGLFQAAASALDALSSLSGEVEPDAFCAYLKTAFSFLSVGELPSSPNALCAGEISFTRLKKVRRLYLVGANASIFPAPKEAPDVFSDREKELCAAIDPQFDFLESGGSLEEYFYFYLAASTPTDLLTVSYHLQSLNGEEQVKSVFIDRLKFLFPKLFEDENGKEMKLEPTLPTAAPINESMLYSYLCAHRGKTDEATLILRRYALEQKLFSPPMTQGEIAAMRDHRSAIVTDSFRLSQSKLETFARCPYRYFLKYDLNLSPDPKAQMDDSMLGELAHYVAEFGYRRLISKHLSPDSFDRSAIYHLVREASDDYFKNKLPPDIGRTRRFFAQTSRMERANIRLMENLFADSAQSAYRPVLFEASLEHELPPYSLVLPDKTRITFSGKADRIDLARTPGGDFACVIDYKTGTKKMELEKVYRGLETQLFVYLCALRSGGLVLNGQTIPVTPAAAFYLGAYAGIPEGKTLEEAQKKIDSKLARRGLYLDDPSALSAFGNAVTHGFSYKGEGTLKATSGSVVLDQPALNALLDRMEDQFRSTAISIKSGKIERKPLKKGNLLLGCDYCDYRAICRMESGGECRNYYDSANAPHGADETEVADDE